MLEHIKPNHREWKPALKKQGLFPMFHSKSKDLSWLPSESRSTDRLTDLPILNSGVRKVLVRELSQCIRNNGKWASLYADADQLKTANDKYGRDFGDVYISWGTKTVMDAVKKTSFTDGVFVRAVRPSHAADETIVWFFNLTNEDIQKIKKVQESIGTQVLIPELSFNFSLSAGLLTSEDLAIKEFLSDTQKWLLVNPKAHAFDLFQKIEDKTDELTKVEKIAKDLYRLPLVELMEQKNIESLINVMRNNLGGSRISDHLLELILKLQSIHTLRLLSNQLNHKTYTAMLRELGVKTTDLNNVESADALVRLFRGLFGKE